LIWRGPRGRTAILQRRLFDDEEFAITDVIALRTLRTV